MKKILLAVVLGVAVVAVAQDAAQPAQGQPGAAAQGQAQGPVIKDPAEYNAYVAAVQQKDTNAKISGLEAFLTQYPNSVMKNQALELLMGAYQQARNMQKTTDTATKLVAADPCNMRALALLAYFDRIRAQGGDPNALQLLGGREEIRRAGYGLLAQGHRSRDLEAGYEEADDQHLPVGDWYRRRARTRTIAGCITALKPVVGCESHRLQCGVSAGPGLSESRPRRTLRMGSGLRPAQLRWLPRRTRLGSKSMRARST